MSIFKKVKEEMKFSSPTNVTFNGDHESFCKPLHNLESIDTLYSSVVPLPQSGTDPDTCLEVFKSHWLQAVTIMNKLGSASNVSKKIVLSEEVDTVLQHLDQMMLLLIEEKGQGIENLCQGPILQYLLCEDILEKSQSWAANVGEFQDRIQLHFLKTFDLLVGQANQVLLIHKPVIRPLLRLLSSCTQHRSKAVEKQVVLLVHALCVRVTQNTQILELLFNANAEHGPTKFLIFSLLIPYVHCEDSIGQQARDALLLIMTLSNQHHNIGAYIADYSDFCPVLATGLSALYSSLPRKWSSAPDDWYCITTDDISNTPQLNMFLNSLEFCNAVIQVSHVLVKKQLLSYIYNGFLVPVIAPALHQSSLEEVVAATAYFDLFIRKTTETLLIETFMKFILSEKYDHISILDSLVSRISGNSRLCMVTLSLFSTLCDLHCEDLMYQLIFKYLTPCTHVMVSQKRCIRDIDIYCKSAERFLSLTPNCCRLDESDSSSQNSDLPSGQNSPISSNSRSSSSPDSPLISSKFGNKIENFQTNYSEYLQSARQRIKDCAVSSSHWSNKYDGESVGEEHNTLIDNKTVLDSAPSSYERGYESCFSSSLNTHSTPKEERWPDLEKHVYDPGIKEISIELSPDLSSQNSNFPKDMNSNDQLIANKTSDNVEKSDMNKSNFSISLTHILNCQNSPHGDAYDDSVSSESDSALCGSPSDGDNATCNADNACSGSDSLLNDNFENNDFNDFLLYLKKVKSPDESCNNIEDSITELDSIFEDYNLDISNIDENHCRNISLIENDYDLVTTNELTDENDKSKNITSVCNIACDENLYSPIITSNSALLTSSNCDRNMYSLCTIEALPHELPSSLPNSLFIRPSSSSISSLKSNNTPPFTPSKFNFNAPNIGDFLSAVLTKLETMMQNSLYINLLLTGLLSCLACYPQPLLRSFLLNHSLVFQPSVKSLIQVLSGVKQKVERYSSGVKDFNQLYFKAWRFLCWREGMPISAAEEAFSKTRMDGISPLTSHQPENLRKEKKRSGSLLSDFFRRSSHSSGSHNSLKSNKFGNLQLMTEGYKFVNRGSFSQDMSVDKMESVKSKNAVYCALVLEEFLKELAAICQEHAVFLYNDVT